MKIVSFKTIPVKLNNDKFGIGLILDGQTTLLSHQGQILQFNTEQEALKYIDDEA